MTTPPNDLAADEEPIARPFLSSANTPAPPTAAPDAAGWRPTADPNDLDQEVRPYVITASRAHTGHELPLEALVRTTGRGHTTRASYESARILDICGRNQSVAEISAHLRFPVGVTRVLVADLAAAGLVEVSTPSATHHLFADPAFLQRLMLGVAAL